LHQEISEKDAEITALKQAMAEMQKAVTQLINESKRGKR